MAALIGVLLSVGGCYPVIQTTSQPAPEAPARRYPRLLVAAVASDLRLQQQAESSLVRAAVAAGVTVVPYHTVFLPGQQYADSEITAEMVRRDIPAVLIIEDATTDAPTVSVSAVAVPLCYRTVGGQCVSGSTIVTSNRIVSQDKFTIASRVIDRATGRAVWIGSTNVQRNGATNAAMLSDLAANLMRSLVKDSVVSLAPPAPGMR